MCNVIKTFNNHTTEISAIWPVSVSEVALHLIGNPKPDRTPGFSGLHTRLLSSLVDIFRTANDVAQHIPPY